MKHVNPKHLTDLEALELIYGPPEEILTYAHFRPYQKWMAQKMIELPGSYIGAEMGLGKTAAVLYAIQHLISKGIIKNVLIIAPLRVAEETWPEEIAKWDFARHLTYRVVTGDKDQRRAALTRPAKITIVNRENLLWLLKGIGMKRWRFDMIVYDEASRLKKGVMRTTPKPRKDGTVPDPQLTELGVLHRVHGTTKKIIELSGTPSPNGLIDLYGPIYAIDQGKRLGSSKTAFDRRWFVTDKYTMVTSPMAHAEADIMGRIEDIFFSLREEDYLDLPPMVPVDHEVHMTRKEMQGYRDFEKETAIEVLDKWGEPEVIEAVNNGVLTGKLLQYANGSLYREDHTAFKIHNHKLDVLESIIEEAAGKPILVAYSFKFDKDAIKKRFPWARIFGENKNDMRDWNAGKIKMLVTHPASAGHGLNFQKASNIAVWYGLTWSLELYRQFIKRLHRSGQKEDKVFLHRILTVGTGDYDVLEVLKRRGATQDQITEAVRIRLKRAARA
jgi:SNF2 family DNA or RNA helicase